MEVTRAFISYAHEDRNFVGELANRLHSAGIDVWFDQALKPGEQWSTELEERIRRADAMVVVVSPASTASKFVPLEILYARRHGKLVVPLIIKDVSLPLLLGGVQTVNARGGIDYLPDLVSALKGTRPATESDYLSSPDVGRFDSLVEEKTRQFVGRKEEIADIKRWVEKNKYGFRLICGDPGIGKTALISALSRIGAASLGVTFKDPLLVDLLSGQNWPNWPNVSVIPYFILRGEVTTKPTEFLSNLLKRLSARYDLRCGTIGSAQELTRELQFQLQVVSKRLRQMGGKLLLLLIDGLDESLNMAGDVEAGESLLRYIPRDVPEGIFVVLGGRRRPEVEDLRGDLNREKVTVVDLKGLSEEDVRFLLRVAIDNDEIDPQYVAQVTHLSQGNPLYVRLLMESLRRGQHQINEVEGLPENLTGFYRTIEKRLIGPHSDAALKVLMTLALAREQLSAEQIGGIAGLTILEACHTIDACLEVLKTDRAVDGRAVYRIFHDSFAEYMRTHPDYAALLPQMRRRILEFAARPASGGAIEEHLANLIGEMFDGSALRPTAALSLAELIERASRMLTGNHIVLQNLVRRPFDELGPLLTNLGRSGGAATARMTAQCLISAAAHDGAGVQAIIVEFAEFLLHHKASALTSLPPKGIRFNLPGPKLRNIQAARIALDVAVELRGVPSMAETVRQVLLAGCCSRESTVRSLAVVALFRVVQTEYGLGVAVLDELARRSVWLGLPRFRIIGAFAGAAMSLFFERPDDPRLTQDLKRMVRELVSGILGIKLFFWLSPTLVSLVWSWLADDYNAMNVAELTRYKKYARRHPEIVAAANKLIDLIDPASGTTEEFAESLLVLKRECDHPESIFGLMFVASSATTARALVSDDAVMEKAFQVRKDMPPDHTVHQDFMYWLRITQLGRKLLGQPPLGDLWAPRMETLIRRFFCEHRGVYAGSHQTYVLGGMISGIVFLAHQTGSAKLPLVAELIDWAVPSAGLRQWPGASRERQPDALLARVLEVIGLEFGVFDLLSRQTAFFGIHHFLTHSPKFDSYLWDRLATILVRMRTFLAEEVGTFLDQIPHESREPLQIRMSQILPSESVGSLISNFRIERFVATVLAEPPGEPDGLRKNWQDVLRVLLSADRIAPTMRFGFKTLINLAVRGTKQ
jgi:TIR domain-containing protein